MRSILLTKHIRGTLYLLAWRQTVSVWGSTPATASKTATAPSRTRSDRSTSTVKSTWPGVSMMLIHVSRHLQVVAARRDGDAALLLLDHPVHDRGALVDLADLVGAAGVVEDPLGRGGLARVDVGHDPDVPHPRERHLPDHRATLRLDLTLFCSHLFDSLLLISPGGTGESELQVNVVDRSGVPLMGKPTRRAPGTDGDRSGSWPRRARPAPEGRLSPKAKAAGARSDEGASTSGCRPAPATAARGQGSVRPVST